MALPKIEKRIRANTPRVGTAPFGQVHAHSTGNRASTVQNEADYAQHSNLNNGFYSHVVGNGRIIQVAPVNRGHYDVGGGWNRWGHAAVELIESHKTKADFMRDYKIYVELLRKLASDAGIRKVVDSGNTGIITHDYCRRYQPNNKTDHVDPYVYLNRWGISKAQFKKDVEGGKVKGDGGSAAPSKPKPTAKKPASGKIAEDGQFGTGTAKRLQQIYKRKICDGVISGQIKTNANRYVYAARWGTGGSIIVKKIQKELKLNPDGNIGPATVKAMQRKLGTSVDGVISPKSNMVKAMQKKLNAGKRPF